MASSTGTSLGDVDSTEHTHSAASNDTAGTNQPQSNASASPRPLKRASTTPILSATSSTASSPKPSREVSPVRPQLRPAISANSRTTRSRKNSQDFSPSRAPSTGPSNITTVPSAAAIQRALSVAGIPQLQSSVSQDNKGDAPKLQRPGKGLSGNVQSPSNPPRVKSPPPPVTASKALNLPQRKAESAPTTPSIVLERTTPSIRSSTDAQNEGEKDVISSGMRTPARGISGTGPALETVQENSLPSTPAAGLGPVGELTGQNEPPGALEETSNEDLSSKNKVESGSESGGRKDSKAKVENKTTAKPASAMNSSKPQIMHTKKSFTQLLPTKAKVQEGSAKNMIVETETVSTIPQVALGGGAGERNITGRTETGVAYVSSPAMRP
ncbi:vacuolar segregation subunit 7 [Physcia stellaris]|nr:vacuolar segregation subunit 7 [Physcia stellaris]